MEPAQGSASGAGHPGHPDIQNQGNPANYLTRDTGNHRINHWTAIGFVDGGKKLGLWLILLSQLSSNPNGLRSGCGTRAPN